ncbi:MAG: polyphosphate:AMP phosphotransferase [Formivibrio sp.]|nr:polyphosphate:AMP phosphotransferase [Formivibrio sp.]
MFESAELGHKIDKDTYKAEEAQLRQALLEAQYELGQRADFPVLILFAGVPAAGKGEMVNLLMEWLDPRHVTTHAFGKHSDEERTRPPMWRYWRILPPKGKMAMLFGGWYAGAMFETLSGGREAVFQREIERIAHFEKMLADEGVLVLKFWLHLSEDALNKRLKKLLGDKLTSWRVTDEDRGFARHYGDIIARSRAMLMRTSSADAPWRVVEGADANYRALEVGKQLLSAMRHHLGRNSVRQSRVEAAQIVPSVDGLRLLDTLQLDHANDRKDYKNQLEVLQGRLNLLTRHPQFQNLSVVMVFEGMDAAGKGGAIRRITAALDARQYHIVPIAAPTDEERAQPYLWRFWRQLPSHGRFTIFDRSWYGRVLVERVEGFAPVADWMRAYGEINEFESQLDDANTLVVKYWLAISKEEQLARFQEREQTQWKRFKITDEDWRNREKWDDYVTAASDMIDRTSTPSAPWHLIAANNKTYARIRVLEILCETIECRLDKKEKKSQA